jgi:anti-sigma regulatory factor (Ser/Thr protein kinase)
LGAAGIDWEAHAAGPPAQWPTEVRTAVGLALSAQFPAVVWFGGPATWHQIPNDTCRSLLGERHPLTATGSHDGPGTDDAVGSILACVLRTAAASSTTLRIPTADGAAAWHRTLRLSVGPVFAGDGSVCAVFGTITDFDPASAVPDPDRAEQLSVLRSAIDAAMCEQDVAAAFLCCPQASWAADAVSLGVIDPAAGTLRIIFVGDIPAEQRDRYHAVAVDGPGPMAESVRTGRTVLVQNTAHGQETHRSVLSDFAHILGTLVFNPLRDPAGISIGALALGWSTPRSVSSAELAHLTAATALAGPALARVQAAEKDRHIAAELQDHLLDLDRSSTAAAIAAVHRPAADGSWVGGHWYLSAPGGTAERIALCVGSVVGRELAAAAVMSRLRSTIVVAAASTDDPGRVLDAVDRHARTVRGACGAAVAHAVLDTAHQTVAYTCAGNPYPLLVAPDGRIQYLTGGRRPRLAESTPGDLATAATADLPAGALLVLYTAGLVERRGAESTAGLDRLAEAAQECATMPVGAVCAHLLDRMAGPNGFADEVALLAVRPSGVTPNAFVQVIPALTDQIVNLRHRLGTWLAPRCPEPFLGEILISVGEALSNAVDHGSDPAWAHTVSVESFLRGDELTTTVSDCGRWTGDSSASRREAVRGRGLKMIHALSRRVETVRSPHGTRMTMHHALARYTATGHVEDNGSHTHRR